MATHNQESFSISFSSNPVGISLFFSISIAFSEFNFFESKPSGIFDSSVSVSYSTPKTDFNSSITWSNGIVVGITVSPNPISFLHFSYKPWNKSVFGVEYETETEESKIPEGLDSKKLNSEKAIDIEKNNEMPTGFDENEIENDSWFVPAYDEER